MRGNNTLAEGSGSSVKQGKRTKFQLGIMYYYIHTYWILHTEF